MIHIGKLFLVLGLTFLVLGLVMLFGHRIPLLGKLPGDIHIVKSNFQFHFPIITCILFSLFISLIFWIFRR